MERFSTAVYTQTKFSTRVLNLVLKYSCTIQYISKLGTAVLVLTDVPSAANMQRTFMDQFLEFQESLRSES